MFYQCLSSHTRCPVGCSENIKNKIFYYADSYYGALIYIWNRNLKKKFKFQIFSWVLRHLKIWNILTKVKIQVARKYTMWVFKTTALEPRSQRSNRNKDPSSLDREIVQKLFKSVHPNIMTKFEQFLRDFLVWRPWIFLWFKCGSFECLF